METKAIEPRPDVCEVRLYDGGRLFAIERCPSRADARALLRRWEQYDGISGQVIVIGATSVDHPVAAR